MNKQQIINHIACKLESLVNGVQPVDAPIQIALLATLLRDITRDDDYSYSSQPPNGILQSGSISGLTTAYTANPVSFNDSPLRSVGNS